MTLIDRVKSLLDTGHVWATFKLAEVLEAIHPAALYAPSLPEPDRFMAAMLSPGTPWMEKLTISKWCVGGYVRYSDYEALAERYRLEVGNARVKLKRAAKIVASYKALERSTPYAMFIPTWAKSPQAGSVNLWDGPLEQSYWANGIQPVRFYVNPIVAHGVSDSQVDAALAVLHSNRLGWAGAPTDEERADMRKALIAAMRA